MHELSRYQFEPLWAEGECVLSRSVRDAALAPLLLVAPVVAQPAPESLQRLAHAYALREALEPIWAACPRALVRHQGQPTLVLADPGGEVLARLVGQPWEVTPFLRVAIGLAVALGRLHARGLIHKDVKPANVLTNAATGDVWLTGFGIASRLPRERQAPALPEVIAGTLAYMAPEQTGRMHRSIDARSDLYATASSSTRCSRERSRLRLLRRWSGSTATSRGSRCAPASGCPASRVRSTQW